MVGSAERRAGFGDGGVERQWSGPRFNAAADPLEGEEALTFVEARHEIGQDQRAFGPVKGGGQQVRVAEVDLLAGRDGVDGGDAKAAAALPVEDGGEDGGGVES